MVRLDQSVKLIPSLHLWKTEAEEVLVSAYCGPSVTLISKLGKDFPRGRKVHYILWIWLQKSTTKYGQSSGLDTHYLFK